MGSYFSLVKVRPLHPQHPHERQLTLLKQDTVVEDPDAGLIKELPVHLEWLECPICKLFRDEQFM
jgi:hypothetical protein